jgi:amino acid permease
MLQRRSYRVTSWGGNVAASPVARPLASLTQSFADFFYSVHRSHFLTEMSSAAARERSPLLPSTLDVPASNSYQLESNSSPHGVVETLEQHVLSPIKESMARGSVASSIVNLCTASLGAGCLSIPWALCQSGLVTGVLMLWAAAIATNFTIRLLVRLYATDAQVSFESLAMRAFGPIGSAVTHFTVLLYCFGTAVADVIVVGDVLVPVMGILLPDAHFLHHKAAICTLLTLAIMLPLSFYQQVSSLRLVTLLSTGGVVLLALVLLLQGGFALAEGTLQPMELTRWDGGILLCLPVVIFSFSCQANLFEILEEQIDQRRATDFRIVNIAMCIDTFVYTAIGVAGYALFGADVDGNVLRNLDLHRPLHVLAQLAIGISLCLSYPLCIIPARFTLKDMLFKDDATVAESAFAPRSALITLGLVVSSLLFAILVPSISELFTVLGSTTGALIAFILPASFYLRLAEKGEKQLVRRRLCKLMLVGATLMMVVTTYRSIEYVVLYRGGHK